MAARVDDALWVEVLEIVLNKLTLLGYSDPTPLTPTGRKSSAPSPLNEPMDEVQQAICNYCNIDSVPQELKYVWANMVVDLWRWMMSVAAGRTSSSGGPNVSNASVVVSSLKEGDTTVGFSVDTASHGAQAGNAHAISGVLDQVVMNYQDQLNRFRKVVW